MKNHPLQIYTLMEYKHVFYIVLSIHIECAYIKDFSKFQTCHSMVVHLYPAPSFRGAVLKP